MHPRIRGSPDLRTTWGLIRNTARIAREGLVRLYYQREFDRQQMRRASGRARREGANATDNLVA